ncbi:MAG: hypothetical protein Q9222_002402 [Ikaeria aurantiellina]
MTDKSVHLGVSLSDVNCHLTRFKKPKPQPSQDGTPLPWEARETVIARQGDDSLTKEEQDAVDEEAERQCLVVLELLQNIDRICGITSSEDTIKIVRVNVLDDIKIVDDDEKQNFIEHIQDTISGKKFEEKANIKAIEKVKNMTWREKEFAKTLSREDHEIYFGPCLQPDQDPDSESKNAARTSINHESCSSEDMYNANGETLRFD